MGILKLLYVGRNSDIKRFTYFSSTMIPSICRSTKIIPPVHDVTQRCLQALRRDVRFRHRQIYTLHFTGKDYVKNYNSQNIDFYINKIKFLQYYIIVYINLSNRRVKDIINAIFILIIVCKN